MAGDGFSHLDDQRQPQMVDVGAKEITERVAEAVAVVLLPPEVRRLLADGELHAPKGPVFQTAITAGIMGAKRTSELIPLCHPLPLDSCSVQIELTGDQVAIRCRAKVHHRTGVEMEALTGATVAALTVYDMCKGLSHEIVIKEVRLVHKRGGTRDIGRHEAR